MPRNADYRFYRQYKNSETEVKAIMYQVWISDNKEQLEIIKPKGYIQLSKENSSILFEVLTDKKKTSYEGRLCVLRRETALHICALP
ncbi:hypothetical protein [Pontibacillus sp. HMF3514]|uniref:hypothetical protein n=1 Tax=Pontibacillus sp. HMF3514 TaxID=2692425 RepID=UPI00132025B4|nr:hypothetical protein [Pontibacillus sp. HMF3514]QHE52693.1 hypothetical protein GS400_11910 [Pontibacillus sp. HMF3514]